MAQPEPLAKLALREGVELIDVRTGADCRKALFRPRDRRARLWWPISRRDRTRPRSRRIDPVYSREEMAAALARRPALAAEAARGFHGVDLRVFSPEAVDAARVRRLREALGVKAHVRLVVALGLPAERRQSFLAAAAQLKAKNFFANDAQEARFVWLRGEGETASPAFERRAYRA